MLKYRLMHYLFSYGTLQLEKVQLENYDRILTGKKDRIVGYKIEDLLIIDAIVLSKSQKNIHPVAVKTNNKNHFIEGIIFEITEDELLETDKYEVSDYKRILETFDSGKQAWIYVAKK